MSDLALEVDHVTKTFRLHHEKTNSLKQLDRRHGGERSTTSSSRSTTSPSP